MVRDRMGECVREGGSKGLFGGMVKEGLGWLGITGIVRGGYMRMIWNGLGSSGKLGMYKI